MLRDKIKTLKRLVGKLSNSLSANVNYVIFIILVEKYLKVVFFTKSRSLSNAVSRVIIKELLL